ncbi:hypothetical protein ACFQ7B_40125 [Streptomyces erythrochromogenes]|uniref:hypothetical protein n=1 Tax=Streptomyces erythrochromogenes TaxID=285574 RepID=UPI0036B4729D
MHQHIPSPHNQHNKAAWQKPNKKTASQNTSQARRRKHKQSTYSDRSFLTENNPWNSVRSPDDYPLPPIPELSQAEFAKLVIGIVGEMMLAYTAMQGGHYRLAAAHRPGPAPSTAGTATSPPGVRSGPASWLHDPLRFPGADAGTITREHQARAEAHRQATLDDSSRETQQNTRTEHHRRNRRRRGLNPYAGVQAAGALDFLLQGSSAIDESLGNSWIQRINIGVPSQFPGLRRARNAMEACDRVEGLRVLMREIDTSVKTSPGYHGLKQMKDAAYRLSMVDHSPSGGAGRNGVFGAGINAGDHQLILESLDMVLQIWDARRNIYEAGGATAAPNVNRSIIDGRSREVDTFTEMLENVQYTLFMAGMKGKTSEIRKMLAALEVLKYKSMGERELSGMTAPAEARVPFNQERGELVRKSAKLHRLRELVRLSRDRFGEGFETKIMEEMTGPDGEALWPGATAGGGETKLGAAHYLRSLKSDPRGDTEVGQYTEMPSERIRLIIEIINSYNQRQQTRSADATDLPTAGPSTTNESPYRQRVSRILDMAGGRDHVWDVIESLHAHHNRHHHDPNARINVLKEAIRAYDDDTLSQDTHKKISEAAELTRLWDALVHGYLDARSTTFEDLARRAGCTVIQGRPILHAWARQNKLMHPSERTRRMEQQIHAFTRPQD